MSRGRIPLPHGFLLAVAAGAVLMLALHSVRRRGVKMPEPRAIATTCRDTAWNVPVPFTNRAPDPRAARGGTLLVRGDRRLLVGTDLRSFEEQLRRGRTLAALQNADGALGLPSGEFLFLSPRAALDLSGAVVLVWGEPAVVPDTILARDWPTIPVVRLWSAVYREVGGWSAPVELLDQPVAWSKETTGEIFRDRDGSLTLSVPLEGNAAAVLSRIGDGWNVDTVSLEGHAAYTSAVRLGAWEAVAVVSADPNQSSDINSVFLYRRGAASTWSRASRIQLSGTSPASEVHLLVGSYGDLHAVWRQSIDLSRFSIRHAVSLDTGVTWSMLDDLRVERPIQRVQAVLDSCNQLHVVYEDWTRGPSDVTLGYARWNQRWVGPTEVHGEFAMTDPALSVSSGGNVALAFWGAHRTVDGSAANRMWFSWRE